MPSHVRQLHMIQQENEQIRMETAGMRQKLERTQAMLTEASDQAKQGVAQDWSKTLRVMQQELAHCRERQRKIRANYEERVAGLQAQLQQAKALVPEVDMTFNPQDLPSWDSAAEVAGQEVVAMQQRIMEVTQRRDELRSRWSEMQRAVEKGFAPGPAAATPPGTESLEVQHLRAQSKQNEAELEGLRQELALQHEREEGTEHQRELRHTVSQLYEELDELQREREDERVRSESEVRELRSERDVIKDRLDDASSELQRLRSQAEALRAMQAQAEGETAPSAAELAAVRAENQQRELELQRLRGCEEERKQTILELEREQEELVEQISLRAAQAVPLAEGNGPEEYAKALEAKARELSELLQRAEAACQDRKGQVARLRRDGEDARAAAEVLRQSYDALQRSSDERMMRSPSPGPPPP